MGGMEADLKGVGQAVNQSGHDTVVLVAASTRATGCPKPNKGDFRDWDDIRTWAASIAAAL